MEIKMVRFCLSEFLLSRTDKKKYHFADMGFLTKNSPKLINFLMHSCHDVSLSAPLTNSQNPPEAQLHLRNPFNDIYYCELRGATTHCVRGEEQEIKFTYYLISSRIPPPQLYFCTFFLSSSVRNGN